MTFEEIMIHESRLIPLISDCYYASYIPNDSLRSDIYNKLIHPRLSKLVGWYCDDDGLKTQAVYDLVGGTLRKIIGV